MFQTLLKYQHMHLFQYVILPLTEPFSSINKVVVFCLFVCFLTSSQTFQPRDQAIYMHTVNWITECLRDS